MDLDNKPESLSSDQLQIVRHGTGPLMVVAGPGSGKTRVLAERFVRLVERGRARADQILVLTYNADAAAEMVRRVATRLGNGDYPIFTYHAFARRSLAEFGWLAGLPPFFRLLTEKVEQWLRIEAVVNQLKPSYFYPPQARRDLRPLQGFISRSKHEAVSPSRIRAWAESKRTGRGDADDQLAELYRQAALIYEAVEAKYDEENCLDFDDLILKLELAMEEAPALKAALQQRYLFYMVDEYQDTNFTQALLIERLVPPPHNVVVVADDDQSIYKFRGASLANIVRFQRVYAGAIQVALGRNYRSTREIVGVTASVIGLNTSREPKSLVSVRDSGSLVRIVESPDLLSEAAWVAHECKRLIEEEGVQANQIAILSRTNAQLRPFAEALASANLAYELSGGGDFFMRPEIKDLVALLRAAVDPDDDLALIRLLTLPRYHLEPAARLAAARWLRQSGSHLVAASHSDLNSLSEDDWERFERMRLDITDLAALALHASGRDVIHAGLEHTSYVGVAERSEPVDALEAAANIRKFADLAARFDRDHPGGNAKKFLIYLDLAALADTEEAGLPRELSRAAIQLSTAHSAKGLEFQNVFVVNAAEGRFPIRGAERLLDVPLDLVEEAEAATPPIDEERRLFYVAATRAQNGLTLTYALRYTTWAKEPVRPSVFLTELRERVPELLQEVKAPQVALPPVKHPVSAPVRSEATAALSVSEMLTFSDCPRRYGYQHYYLLPQRPIRQLTMGSLVHAALEQAAYRRKAGSEVTDAELLVFVEEASSAALYDKQAWGDLVDEAKSSVLKYASTAAWKEAEILEAEMDFEVELNGIHLKGRIDRIDRLNDRLKLIDYKSGRARTQQEVDKDPRIGRQFGLYKLAAQRLLKADLELEAHFLNAAEVVPVSKSAEQLERDSRWAWAVSNEIRSARAQREFPAKPSDFTCPLCPFRLVCDEGQEFLRRH